jgi:hypothetical protein
METGKAYLIHCGDWHTFVGRVVRQVGPSTYLLEGCSKISETNNGDVWFDMAAGDKKLRKAATYVHAKTPLVIPLVIAAVLWEGKTPAEETAL